MVTLHTRRFLMVAIGYLVLLPLGATADPVVVEAAPAAPAQAPSTDTPSPATPEAPALPTMLDLATAQATALAQNPSIQAVVEIVEQARQRVVQARSAYFPQISAEYTATHTELSAQTLEDARAQARSQVQGQITQGIGQAFTSDNPNAALGALGGTAFGLVSGSLAYDMIDDSVEQYKASLSARYLVFDGFARRFQYAQAKFGVQETKAALREARRLLLDGVAKTYYGVQLARENIAVFQADMAFNERLLAEAKARREAGFASLSDELNFEVLLRASRSQLITAEGEYRSARIALATLMGLPEAGLPEATEIAALDSETAEEMTLPEVPPLLARARDLRPDLDRQAYAVERAEAALGQRKGTYYPQVGAFASVDASRSQNSRLNMDDSATTVGVNVKYDLFTGGRHRAAVAEAKHAAREAEYRLQESTLQAESDVRAAVEDIRTAQANLLLARTSVELVEKNRDLVEKEYDVGQTPLVRLNQAQRDLVEAQARLALARVNLKATWHSLRTATGETVGGE